MMMGLHMMKKETMSRKSVRKSRKSCCDTRTWWLSEYAKLMVSLFRDAFVICRESKQNQSPRLLPVPGSFQLGAWELDSGIPPHWGHLSVQLCVERAVSSEAWPVVHNCTQETRQKITYAVESGSLNWMAWRRDRCSEARLPRYCFLKRQVMVYKQYGTSSNDRTPKGANEKCKVSSLAFCTLTLLFLRKVNGFLEDLLKCVTSTHIGEIMAMGLWASVLALWTQTGPLHAPCFLVTQHSTVVLTLCQHREKAPVHSVLLVFVCFLHCGCATVYPGSR